MKINEETLITYGIHFDEHKFKNAKQSDTRNFLNKPDFGLWCSPINSNWGWKDWCESEDFRTAKLTFGTKFKLKDDAKLLVIDNYNDLLEALKKFGTYFFEIYDKVSILDFDSIIKEGFDGMYLTEEGNRQCHLPFGGPRWATDLNTWDCESLIIFKKEVMKDIELF